MTVLLGAQAAVGTGNRTDGSDDPSRTVKLRRQASRRAAPATSGATPLDKITIVSRTGETAIEQMASVSHVDQEQLDRRMAATPQDVLFGVPGVAMQSDANRTASSVNIRGLQDFGRVAVIVDGARQNFQRSGHGTQSMFWLDPELVQQVDVIRGPVANTYGSGAIGGVVVFDTKDAEDFLRPGETWAGFGDRPLRYQRRRLDHQRHWRLPLQRFLRRARQHRLARLRRLHGRRRRRGCRQQLRRPERPAQVDHPSDRKQRTEARLDRRQTTAGPRAAIRLELEIKQNTFTGRYNIKDDDESWLDLHINVAYNKTDLDQTYLTDVDRFDSVTGLPIIVPAGSQTTYDLDTPSFDIWNTSRFDTGAVAHELTYGGDWVQDDVVTSSPSGGSDVYTPSGKRRVSGAYIQEKLIWEWLEVVGALRYDSYSSKATSARRPATGCRRASPSACRRSRTMALEGLQIYGTYAEGYRSPSLSETLISGLHPERRRLPLPAQPEPYARDRADRGVRHQLRPGRHFPGR